MPALPQKAEGEILTPETCQVLRTGAEYLAGLWRQDLPFGLLWQGWHGEGKRVTDKWRAPSWSWTSIDGPVNSQGYRAGAILLDKILDEAVILSAEVHL